MQCSVVSASSSRTCLPVICFCHVQFSAKSENCNETCLIDMGVIVFSDPFWLMVSKGLLLSALSRFIPRHIFAMSCYCNLLFACSKHVILMLISGMLLFSLS